MVKPAQTYVVITPVRDEARYIEATIASVVRQTVPPLRWIVVDDGSTDGTAAILDRHASGRDWMKVIHRVNRGFRAAGGGVVESFNAGYSALGDQNWNFVVKLDGDLSFAPDYFERCLMMFSSDVRLGIAGGTILRLENGRTRVDSIGDPQFHVRGATKIYRRECWDEIGPLARAPGWDTIDEVKANMYGWKTRTFADLVLVQHKPTGEADGQWRNSFKNGRANYMTGYHPMFMFAKCIKRAAKKPVLVQSAGLIAGYASGYFKRVPRAAERETIRYLRRQQLRRLLLRSSIYG